MFCKFFYSELQSQSVKSLGFYEAPRRTPAAHEHDHIMLYVLIFNKPFLANFVSSKNVYTCLNACIFVNMASKCAWHI